MTEDQVLRYLPQTTEWDPELRARLVEGINELNGCSSPEPDLASIIGMIIICCSEHPPQARIASKADCARLAEKNGCCEETLAAIRSPALPNHLDIFAYVAEYEIVFGMPVQEARFERFHNIETVH